LLWSQNAFPCHYPANRSFTAERATLVFDFTRLLLLARFRKKFFPVFYPDGRETEVGSSPLEIGALGDRKALQVAAQTVEAEFDGTQPYPVAAAIDARAP
jgi:hypothetical protein